MTKLIKPKYQRIRDELYNLILSNHYKKGDQFFTETELMSKYGVSSITVKNALKELVKDGFLIRKRGKGTFISRSTKDKIVHFSYTNDTANHREEIKVLSLEKGNDPHYLKLLNLHKTEYYYILSRQRFIDQEPYLYQKSYIAHDYILNPETDYDHYHSLYHRFFKDFKIQMAEQNFKQETDITTDYPKEVKDFLQLKDGEPCVRQIKSTKDSKTNRILEYAEVYKNWTFFKFELSSSHY
ncbi:GntR family transcriptional regulator [Streptococcus catagoni]|uniref:GntR family transcriptional regulator n=1 Tax=Streptococcus catagoni TaxID=2654874 RepID=UPI00140E85F4|nr:GntR family transcriptional regulator [Streptococcus catagoni]